MGWVYRLCPIDRSHHLIFYFLYKSSPYPSQDHQGIRALSPANLLQSFNKARVKPKSRGASISLTNNTIINRTLERSENGVLSVKKEEDN